MSLFSFEGASGRSYDYVSLNLKSREAFPMGGGNYVFTRPSGSDVEIVFAGEADSLWSVFVSTMLWDIAKKRHGATGACVHLNGDSRARRLERTDIINRHCPPMNMETPEERAV
ncbi:MAG TPA: hypothetical protein VEU06_05280 [Micropepsaceae bacterium]|jgi:hypothetical protein|nr:hypothetical protein [Micropepsaceae bacterium]